MSDSVVISRVDGTIEVRLNRPEKKNAITASMYAAMADALAEAEGDPAVRAVLICGSGDAFTAGNDLNDFLANPPQTADAPVFRFLRAVSTAEKVLIAAVHGAAVGIGTTMLLHCDLVIASDSARLALPFVNLGLVPEAASSLLLPRLVGHQRAAELLLLGETIDAATAQSLGLVNRVVGDAELMETARALARQIAGRAPAAVRLTKRLLKQTAGSVAERMVEEADGFRRQLQSAEFREAATAFFEKRPADFSPIG